MSNIDTALPSAGLVAPRPARSVTRPEQIDASVASTTLRFALKNRTDIPGILWERCMVPASTGAGERKQLHSGITVVQATKRTSLLAFVDELKREGTFILTGIRAKEWTDEARMQRHSVQFSFNRKPLRYPVLPEMENLLNEHGAPTLLKLCTGTVWTTAVWRNPLDDRRFGFSVSAQKPKQYGGDKSVKTSTLRIMRGCIVLKP
jgi:hypothetical protein